MKWISFKRTVANNFEEMPSPRGLYEQFRKFFGEALMASGGLIEKLYGYSPVSIPVRTMMDTIMYVDNAKHEVTFGIINYRNGVRHEMVNFHPTMQVYSDTQADGKVTTYQVITGMDPMDPTDGKTSMAGLIIKAMEYLNQSEPYVTARWMHASDRFREENLICPKCGALVDMRCHTDDGYLVCGNDDCDWHSHHKYSYRSEFADLFAFQKEVDVVRARETLDAEVDDAMTAIRAGLEHLKGVHAKKNRRAHLTDAEYGKLLSQILAEVTALKKEI